MDSDSRAKKGFFYSLNDRVQRLPTAVRCNDVFGVIPSLCTPLFATETFSDESQDQSIE